MGRGKIDTRARTAPGHRRTHLINQTKSVENVILPALRMAHLDFYVPH